jgi:sensor histidine kinase YesM
MTCQDLDIHPLSEDLLSKLLKYAEEMIEQKKTSLYSYPTIDDEYIELYGTPATGKIFFLPTNLNNEIIEFYKNCSNFNNSKMFIQIISGGKYFTPHIDDVKLRKTTKLCILQTGGNNVETTWWNVKENYANENYGIDPDLLFFPYYKIEKSHSHILKTNSWYELEVNKIHSVENMVEPRISFTFLYVLLILFNLFVLFSTISIVSSTECLKCFIK